MRSPPSRRPARRLIACLIGLLALSGCQEDQITHAIVPRAAEPEKTRVLGVVYPHGDQTWFFKMIGPESAFEGETRPFLDLVDSARFSAPDFLTWKLPDGWKQHDVVKPLYAAFTAGDKPLKISITELPRKKESELLDNVNRWRRQLGLEPVTEADLKTMTKDLTINGEPATLVELVGSAAPNKPMGGAASALPAAQGWNYKKPDGWVEMPHPEARKPVPAEAVFQAGEGAQTAEVSVTVAGGALADNLARWAHQVDAPPPDPDKLPHIVVAGRESPYVDLAGKNGRIVGAIVDHGDRTWFFKMMGPADVVGQQKPAFEEFLKSVRFDEGQGGDK
jgi:hypothetical protein